MIVARDARRLSSADREVLRLRVVAALESGTVVGYRQAVEVFGVSERSVGNWWRAYRRDGRAGLAVRRTRRPGPAELISAEQRDMLFAAMADYTPEELLAGGPLWTRAAVVELVWMVIGVAMTEQGVGAWQRRHGFTARRPAKWTYAQQDARIRAWLDEDYPVLAARAKAEFAVVVWVDRIELRSETAGPRSPVNVLSAVSAKGSQWFTVFPGRFTAPVLITFLGRLARQVGRKVHVIVDPHPVHHGKAVRDWLTTHADLVELHVIPQATPAQP
ncbi:MAG: winged helix-turn-helix domain-containing protein [Actinomycetota bacterium]|nr:winged helix-turn-helix domain-containing protein [Actinomycetota bacterium]